KRRVEDLQLGVESYQKKLNLMKPDTYRADLRRREEYTAHSNPRGFIYQNKDKKNRLMRIDELHKFSDGTLNDVRNALDDRLKGIRMQYLPSTIWRKGDKDRAAAVIQVIEKMLKTRRIMRSLEKFVGGRLTLPGNTITNPKEDLKGITTRSRIAYQGPTIPTTSTTSSSTIVERETEATKDKVHPTNNGSTKDVQPPVVPTKSPILNSEPVITPIIEPVASSDKLCKLTRTPLNEHCSAVLLKKLPEKLGDPGKFLIPCDFPGMAECLALADLDVSINLKPLSMWNKLSLPDLSPTCMTLELADRSISRPVGVAEDVFVKVAKSDKSLIDEPPKVELNDLPPHLEYAFLEEHERTIFLYLSWINAPGTFQRCMMAISHDMIKKTMEVFMDDFLVFETSFQTCLSHLEKMLKRCEDTNLCLKWEKSHFMVKEAIVLGHKISKNGIEVDKAKVDVIAKLPNPTTVKGGIRSCAFIFLYKGYLYEYHSSSKTLLAIEQQDKDLRDMIVLIGGQGKWRVKMKILSSLTKIAQLA
nr:reverse transcriptase domain-containing protein [Tanacetum cinerariifolium]